MTDESRTEELEERLARLESDVAAGSAPSGARAAGRSLDRAGLETAFWSLMRTLFPDETRRHMRAATREQLLAARSYIDHWLQRLEPGESPTHEPEREEIAIE